jgi:poly-gamma-glutamate synthesis protein (capsule biosynthesis protein)
MTRRARISSIPAEIADEMAGVSWHPDDPRCPRLADLALLRLVHVDASGREREGELVVAAAVAEDVVRVFERLLAARFPIARMERVDAHGGDDNRSMAANNSSGFNFRTIAGSDQLSLHALGHAIDINPLWNPYVVGTSVHPPAGAAFLDRANVRPGMIVRPGPVTDAFDAVGWEWGGDWTGAVLDYHHFSRS